MLRILCCQSMGSRERGLAGGRARAPISARYAFSLRAGPDRPTVRVLPPSGVVMVHAAVRASATVSVCCVWSRCVILMMSLQHASENLRPARRVGRPTSQ